MHLTDLCIRKAAGTDMASFDVSVGKLRSILDAALTGSAADAEHSSTEPPAHTQSKRILGVWVETVGGGGWLVAKSFKTDFLP